MVKDAAMTVAIRTDASVEIGTGHVTRCLTLANELRERGADVEFVCREHPGHLCGSIELAGYRVNRLPPPGAARAQGSPAHGHWLGVSQDVDARETRSILGKGKRLRWIVVDHYSLDESWETAMRSVADRVMVIDDLADRRHDCDLLLDQNYYRDLESRYDGLVPSGCRKLLGPRYALLRREFIELRRKLRNRDGAVRRILVFFGGTDPTNETAKAIQSVAALNRPDIEVDVVVGESNPNRDQIASVCGATRGFRFHCEIHNLAELMVLADLAIGGGGATTWERCYLGLPTIVLVLAKNQRRAMVDLAEVGAIINLGDAGDVTTGILIDTLNCLLADRNICIKLSLYSMEIASGCAEKTVAEYLT